MSDRPVGLGKVAENGTLNENGAFYSVQDINVLLEEKGSSGDLPTPTVADAGSVVVVDDEGKYALGEAGGGSPWDAVIRLTHADNSGEDSPTNLTPSIVSGTFADLSAKISNGDFPCILVEYYHPMYGIQFSAIMGYVDYSSSNHIGISLAGYSPAALSYTSIGRIFWNNNDTVVWD